MLAKHHGAKGGRPGPNATGGKMTNTVGRYIRTLLHTMAHVNTLKE